MHKRVIDGEEMGAPGPHGIPLNNLSRLLICQSQAGCLIGKCAPRPERLCCARPARRRPPTPASTRRGGAIIKEIRDASGANLKILTPDELPPCALANDRVVQCAARPRAVAVQAAPSSLMRAGALLTNHLRRGGGPRRIVGPPEAQFIALQHVSRQLRENAPREWPGGPPPCLTLLSAPAPAPAAPAPAYQQPVQQSYQPAPSYQPQPVYGQQPVGQPVYAPAQPAYQQAPQQQAYAPAQPQHYAPAQPAYGQPRYR